MKKLTTAIAALAFAGTASASDPTNIYNGFQVDNPDLYGGYDAAEMATASQPGIGDSSNRISSGSNSTMTSYDVFVMGNPANYSGAVRAGETSAMSPGIGDDTSRLQRSGGIGRTSYDVWSAGNPDLESSF